MRDDLNAVLEFIGAESLTDEEFSSLSLESTEDPLLVYEALAGILNGRDLVSEMTLRLQNYYLSQGIQVVTITQTPTSNIFLGASLDD